MFRELNDRQGLVESLVILTALGVPRTEVPAMTLAESVRLGEQAIQLARQIGGQSLALAPVAYNTKLGIRN